jgi:class 3 adenylate cyclase
VGNKEGGSEATSITPVNRRGLGLKVKLNLGIILIIVLMFASLNTYLILSNRSQRRTEAIASNQTIARLLVGPLLGELVDHDIKSARIKTFLSNGLDAALKLDSRDKELVFVVVAAKDGELVVGRAKPELVVFAGGVTYDSQDRVIEEIIRADGNLGPSMRVKRFPLKTYDRGLIGKLYVGTSLARVEADAQRDILVNLITFALALTILVQYCSMMLSRLVVHPITRVANAMNQVQQGDLKAEVQMRRGDEIGVLADSYNFMVRGLRERERLKDAFNRYVSRQVYEKFQAGEIALSGETRQATVLFCDIRSFTTLSEELSPTDVVAMLNEYFNVMVEIIFRYDGFLNKFIGDALMAVYNVPLDQSEPELRAVKTAIEMMQALHTLNAERQKRGAFAINIGIGINTGPVVAGNIGHQQRLEYTVIGDTVNLAQRLEAQTKESKVPILISQSTYDAVAAYVEADALPPVKVKGKATSIALFAVRGLKS